MEKANYLPCSLSPIWVSRVDLSAFLPSLDSLHIVSEYQYLLQKVTFNKINESGSWISNRMDIVVYGFNIKKVKSHFTLRNSEMGAVAQGLLFNTSGLPENIPVLSKMSVEANQLLCWGTTDLNPTSFSYLIENLSAMAQIISNTSRGFTRTDKFRVSETLDDEAWIDSIVSSIFLESMVR